MKNEGVILDTNWEGEFRYWGHLGWLPYPLWRDHVEAVYGDLGPAAVEWIDAHCPEQHKQRRNAEGEWQ